jgi:CHAD domain-containing protein
VAYRLKKRKPISKGLSRIVSREFDKAIDAMQHAGADAGVAVHEARTHVKKIRAVLRLLQKDLGKSYDVENERLREVAHDLAALRDADAAAGTMKALGDHFPQVLGNSTSDSFLKQFRSQQRAAEAGTGRLRQAARLLRKSADQTSQRVGDVARRAAVCDGMVRGYRRARQALAEVQALPGDGVFHAWRKRVKDHWYHVRLMEGLNPGAASRARALRHLEKCLGDDHNLVLLRGRILEQPSRFGHEKTIAVVLGCAVKYQASLRRRALKLGTRAFASKPRVFEKTIDGWLQ